jgi:hypothetical protein
MTPDTRWQLLDCYCLRPQLLLLDFTGVLRRAVGKVAYNGIPFHAVITIKYPVFTASETSYVKYL